MKHRTNKRKGNILVMTSLMMVMLIAFVALAVDVGYIYTVRNELQRAADAAAIAATWELVDQEQVQGNSGGGTLDENARARAAQFAALNQIGRISPQLAEDDVEVGYIADPSDPASPMQAPDGRMPNAVRVRVQRTGAQNGEVPLFFARVLGYGQQTAQAQATAALLHNFSGFQMPSDGSNLFILPFALDQQTWDNLMNGIGTDSYCYNPSTKSVTTGADGILECNLYPQGAGMPGNRGTIDIGDNNNSTADIARQIVHGMNQSDYNALISGGRSLDLNNETGTMIFNGDTGISAGVKDELASIIGKPRILPIFSNVVGPGNNAEYTIVKFVGVRIMDVKLTGSMTDKKVMIQPCNIVSKGLVRSEGASSTEYVYSSVWLVR
jgi:hypothetical protein